MAVDIEIGSEGITFDLLEKASKIPPVDAGTYEFEVDEVTAGNDSSGRPRISAYLKILNNAKYPNSRVIYGMNLPWIDPLTGKWDVSFGYTFIDFAKGTGKTWQGDLRQPEVQSVFKDSLKGATGFMKVGQKPSKDDTSVIYNTVKILPTKRT